MRLMLIVSWSKSLYENFVDSEIQSFYLKILEIPFISSKPRALFARVNCQPSPVCICAELFSFQFRVSFSKCQIQFDCYIIQLITKQISITVQALTKQVENERRSVGPLVKVVFWGPRSKIRFSQVLEPNYSLFGVFPKTPFG